MGRRSVVMDEPPYSRLGDIMTKIKREQVHAFLVLPTWQRSKFYRAAQDLSLGEVHYPTETFFFEMPTGKRARRTQWPVTAFMVCGHTPKCNSIRPGRMTDRIRPLLPKRKVKIGVETHIPPTRYAEEPEIHEEIEEENEKANTSQESDDSQDGSQTTKWCSLLTSRPKRRPHRSPEPRMLAPENPRQPEQPRHPKRMLDLFSGTGSVGRVYKQEGYEVVSVDSDPRWHPTYPVDVLTWDYKRDL
jgi:hypothetical protein